MSNDLLKPRYKVIADYPGNAYKLGDIITFVEDGCSELIANYSAVNGDRTRLMSAKKKSDKYPHLFKKLEWWEGRNLEEMPEYLNCPSRKMFFKVEKWHKSYFIMNGRQKMQYKNYKPASAAEYEAYLQTLTVK